MRFMLLVRFSLAYCEPYKFELVKNEFTMTRVGLDEVKEPLVW